MDNEPFWKLLKPVHDSAAALCLKLTGDRDQACDLFQETLLTALNRFGSLKDETKFRSWLYRILINSFKNRNRGWWFRRRIRLTPEMLELQPAIDPRNEYESRLKLNRLLSVLSPEDRALVVLHEIEGWPVIDLAEMFKKPEGTIKIRLFRAKRKMRRTVEKRLPMRKTKPIIHEAAYALQRSKTAND